MKLELFLTRDVAYVWLINYELQTVTVNVVHAVVP